MRGLRVVASVPLLSCLLSAEGQLISFMLQVCEMGDLPTKDEAKAIISFQ